MSETSTVTGPLRAALNDIPGVLCLRLQAGTVQMGGHYIALNKRGTPDLVVFLPTPAYPVFIETKAPGEKLRKEQVAWIQQARRLGHDVIVVQSVNEGRDEILKRYKRVEQQALPGTEK